MWRLDWGWWAIAELLDVAIMLVALGPLWGPKRMLQLLQMAAVVPAGEPVPLGLISSS